LYADDHWCFACVFDVDIFVDARFKVVMEQDIGVCAASESVDKALPEIGESKCAAKTNCQG
jgi:hypothetical protein